jgi:hypothetical protein
MKYDWITIALENKGVMTVSQNVHGIAATMHWNKISESVKGDHHSTLPDALNSLNSELGDDAANETTL